MTDLITQFNEDFGPKAIFAGVYTAQPVAKMIDEVRLLTDEGFNIYFESLRARKDFRFFSEDINDICRVLDAVSRDLSNRCKHSFWPFQST